MDCTNVTVLQCQWCSIYLAELEATHVWKHQGNVWTLMLVYAYLHTAASTCQENHVHWGGYSMATTAMTWNNHSYCAKDSRAILCCQLFVHWCNYTMCVILANKRKLQSDVCITNAMSEAKLWHCRSTETLHSSTYPSFMFHSSNLLESWSTPPSCTPTSLKASVLWWCVSVSCH